MKTTAEAKFNNGKTTIIIAQTAMNMWLVWREDSGHQALVKQYTNLDEAMSDYNRRVAFMNEVTAA